jgi:hypothetical protein
MTAKIPTPSCKDYAAFVAAYVQLSSDAPYQKFLDKEQQFEQQQDQSHAHSVPFSDLFPKHQQATTGTLVEETQRELQGLNRQLAVQYDLNPLIFPSALTPLSSIPDVSVVARRLEETAKAAFTTAIAAGSDSLIGSRRGSPSMHSFSSPPSSLQKQWTASQPPRSAVSLTSLLGENLFSGGTATSSTLDAPLSSSSTSSKSSTESAACMPDFLKSLVWYPTAVETTAAFQLIALREPKVARRANQRKCLCESD